MIKVEFSKPPRASTKKIAERAVKKLFARKDLGFWQLPSRDENWRSALSTAEKLLSRGEQLTILGMGGSALGGKCLVDALGINNTVDFLFNTDPVVVEKFLADVERCKKSQFLVISKSGNTLEIASLLEVLVPQLKKMKRKLSDSITVITEPRENPLYNWAKHEGIDIVAHPMDVGGRFSAFSPVGLVPAIYAGVDADMLRAGLRAALSDTKSLMGLAAFYLESFKRKESISVFWSYTEKLTGFQAWLVQLWAESLAKLKGPAVSTPVAYSGTCDQHSVLQQLMEGAKDKAICFLRESKLAEQGAMLGAQTLEGFDYIDGKNLGQIFHTQSLSTEEALRKAKRTTLNIEVEQVDAYSLGQLMMTFELLIGVMGEALKIDAFNQPGVELGKKITKEKLQKSSRL